MGTSLDQRLHAFRDDLADARLRGRVDASTFAEGASYRVVAPVADMRRRPSAEAGLDTQLLMGETVRLFDEADGWAWAQAEQDGYVGYVPSALLGPSGDTPGPDHWIIAPRTHLFSSPDLKSAIVDTASMGVRVYVSEQIEYRGKLYAALGTGGPYAVAAKLAPVSGFAADFVSVAEQLVGTPYLWGGRSAFGIDCSGLVQLAMMMAGHDVLRDSDMQAETIGEPIDKDRLQRGDLVFWDGHVGIMRDTETLLHANAHSMDTVTESLEQALARIAMLYGPPTGYRRPDA